MQEEN